MVIFMLLHLVGSGHILIMDNFTIEKFENVYFGLYADLT